MSRCVSVVIQKYKARTLTAKDGGNVTDCQAAPTRPASAALGHPCPSEQSLPCRSEQSLPWSRTCVYGVALGKRTQRTIKYTSAHFPSRALYTQAARSLFRQLLLRCSTFLRPCRSPDATLSPPSMESYAPSPRQPVGNAGWPTFLGG